MAVSPLAAFVAVVALQGSGAGGVGVAAAGSPDFSGTWTLDRARSEAAAQEAAKRDVAETITQTTGWVQIVTTKDGRSDSARYALGPPPAPESTLDATTAERRAFWQGATLVNEGSVDIEGQTVSFLQRRTLSADGAEMVVETTLKMQHGYTLRGAQTMVTGKDVYVRRP
jgi:hypothetical protein